MKTKLFLNTIIYIFLFLGSSILIKQIEFTTGKFAIIFVILGLSIFISLKFYPFNIKSFYSIEYKNLIYIFIGFFTPIICFISIILVSFYKGYLNQFSFERINIFGNIVSSIYVAITEELFSRGLLFYFILKTTKRFSIAAIISSVIFSIFHSLGASLIKDYPLFILYFTSGVVFCYLFVLSRSIIPCFILHFTNNLMNKIMDFDFGIYEKHITQTSPIIYTPYIMPIILLLFYFIIKHRNIDSIANLI